MPKASNKSKRAVPSTDGRARKGGTETVALISAASEDAKTLEDEGRIERLLKRWRAKQPRDQYNGDLTRAVGLLAGAWTQQGEKPNSKKDDKYPAKRYLVDRSRIDKESRAAIGRLLRSREPIDNHLRLLLAELFDGLPPHSSFDGKPLARRITFARRGSGEPTETKLRNLHIASDYRQMITEGKLKPKQAIGKLCDKYGLKTSAIKGALSANREFVDGFEKVIQNGE